MNDAVGELLSLINGYNYVGGNPVNRVDHSGMCAQPTEWWNPIDVNCYYSAVGLAQRFSQGNSQNYNAWFDILIQKDWGELKAIEALGTSADITGSLNQFMRNSSILPSLFIRNPQVALQALQQWGCQNNVDLGFLGMFAAVGTAGSLSGGATGGAVTTLGGAPVVVAALGGLAVGIAISLLFAGTAADTDTQEEDPCRIEEMERRIGVQTVAQVVGASDYYRQQSHVDRTWVVAYASDMCRNGFKPAGAISWFRGATRNTIYEGHTRFVASRVARVTPIFQPAPFRDFSSAGIDWPRTITWEQVEWGF